MKQKQTTWEDKEVLLCEVPEGKWGWVIEDDCLKWGHGNSLCRVPVNYRFAFASPLSPTEAEAAEWVELAPGLCFYAKYDITPNMWICTTALASLHSRIRAEGFDNPERVIPLVKN